MSDYWGRPFTRGDQEWHDGTLAGFRERFMGFAYDHNLPGMIAQMDQLDAKLRDYRNAHLFEEDA